MNSRLIALISFGLVVYLLINVVVEGLEVTLRPNNLDDPNWRARRFFTNKIGDINMVPTAPAHVVGDATVDRALEEGLQVSLRPKNLEDPNWRNRRFFTNKMGNIDMVPTAPAHVPVVDEPFVSNLFAAKIERFTSGTGTGTSTSTSVKEGYVPISAVTGVPQKKKTVDDQLKDSVDQILGFPINVQEHFNKTIPMINPKKQKENDVQKVITDAHSKNPFKLKLYAEKGEAEFYEESCPPGWSPMGTNLKIRGKMNGLKSHCVKPEDEKQAKGTVVLSGSGVILRAHVLNNARGQYIKPPIVKVEGDGEGAVINAILYTQGPKKGEVKQLNVVNGGKGYKNARLLFKSAPAKDCVLCTKIKAKTVST